MQRLTEIALEKANGGVFSLPEIACWVGGSSQRRFSLIKRALASGEVLHLRRGLYCLSAKYLRRHIDPFFLAQRIYGPSYISLETALSYHGWTPEAVYVITSVCTDRSRDFHTPLGHFSFTRIPQAIFYAETIRVEAEGQAGKGGVSGFDASQGFLLASPLKALADYVYVHKEVWHSAGPVIESLRVEEHLLASIGSEAFDSLESNYCSTRVRRFLRGLRKDLMR